MAVTSCASAELIAVSSLLTFDVYQRYIKPTASPSNLIFVSHAMICAFGLTMAAFACIWNAIGIDLGWLFLVMGLLIGGAVFPAAFAITWRGQSKAGAISGAVGGLLAGIIAWLVVAKVYFGELTVASTGTEYATLAGNLAAIMTGLILTVSISLIKPQNFDWEITRAINAESKTPVVDGVGVHPPQDTMVAGSGGEKDKEKDGGVAESSPVTPPDEILASEDEEALADAELEEEPRKLRGAFKLACVASFVLTFLMDILVSCDLSMVYLFCADDLFFSRSHCLCLAQSISFRRDSLLVGLSSRSCGCLPVRLSLSFCPLSRPWGFSRNSIHRLSATSAARRFERLGDDDEVMLVLGFSWKSEV